MRKKHCNNCGKTSLIFPYVCADCLWRLMHVEQRENNIRSLLSKAGEILKEKGFVEESKSIECMADLAWEWEEAAG